MVNSPFNQPSIGTVVSYVDTLEWPGIINNKPASEHFSRAVL